MNYKNIKVKGENGRYTEEFKDAVRELCRKGLNYSQINEKLGVVDLQFNNGYRQLFWKLRKEVEEGIEVKQLKANNTSSADEIKISESGIESEKTSDGVVKSTETIKPSEKTKSAKAIKPVEKVKSVDDIKSVDKEPDVMIVPRLKSPIEVHNSEVALGVVKIPTQQVQELRTDFLVKIYSLESIIDAKSSELELLKASLEMYKSALVELDERYK